VSKNIEATPQSEVERLRLAAAHLKDNPLWSEAMDVIEAEYVELWVNTEPVQTTHRENAYFMLQAVRKLRQQLQTFAQAGSLQRTSRRNVQD
jgi:hypothetical protein